jgi:hypothetical protein
MAPTNEATMREITGLLASSAGSDVGTAVPTGLIGLAVGLILCFFGVRSLRLTGFLMGFALAALLADVLGADPLISLVIGVAGGIAGFVLLILVFRFSLWLIGGLVGGVIGVRAYQQFFLGESNALVVVLFLFAVGLICGFLADHFRQPVLAVLTAAGGASVTLTGLGHLWPTVLGFLREPVTPGQSAIAAAAWILLSVAGWIVQRRWLLTRAAR